MVYCTVLYCTVLYCTVLYCTVLYCTVIVVLLPPPMACSSLFDFCSSLLEFAALFSHLFLFTFRQPNFSRNTRNSNGWLMIFNHFWPPIWEPREDPRTNFFSLVRLLGP